MVQDSINKKNGSYFKVFEILRLYPSYGMNNEAAVS
jgi:hypothetical protein